MTTKKDYDNVKKAMGAGSAKRFLQASTRIDREVKKHGAGDLGPGYRPRKNPFASKLKAHNDARKAALTHKMQPDIKKRTKPLGVLSKPVGERSWHEIRKASPDKDPFSKRQR